MHLSQLHTWLSRGWWAAVQSLVALIVGGAAVQGPAEPPHPSSLPLAPCHLESLAEEVLCGVHEVHEDRGAGAGRRIPIHVSILPSLRRAHAPDPLFILAGGPGQGARSFAGAVARRFKEVRRTRAVVLVDLRGTGESHPLACLRERDEMAPFADGADAFLGGARECLAELDGDVRHYTHAAALADLDEIRQRLGYARVNLWGGSWGTRAALLYALTYPDAVRSVVLDGAVPLEATFPRTVARDAQRALDLLIDRCSAEAACAAAFPDVRQELDAMLARLDRGPATVSLKHPRTGSEAMVTITRDAVAEIVRVALYTPQDAARLLQVIRRAARNDFGPLAAQYVHSASMSSDDMALGATMAVLCSEDMPQLAAADFDAAGRGTFLGGAYGKAWQARCRAWPLGPPIAIDPGASSAAPALVLSGVHDPVTPPSAGDAMANHFPNSLHVVVPGAAHNASFTGCVPDLIAAFLERGTAASLDTACVLALPLPPLVVNGAGGQP